MRVVCRLLSCLGLLTGLIALDLPSSAQPPAAEAVLVDAGGKEQKVKGWKWVAGTRHLNWLDMKEPIKLMEPGEEPKKNVKTPPKVAPVRPAVGPVALEFRETESTTFVNGVVTLVPLDRLRSLDYDAMKKTVTAKVAAGGMAEDVALVGSTQYKGVNTPVLEAEVDRGPAGIAALKFFGGVPVGGIQKATFPHKMADPVKTERTYTVTIQHEKTKAKQTVADLQPLYQLTTGAEVVAPAMLFKKSLRVELANVRKMVGSNPGQIETSFDVTFKDGVAESLTALNHVKLDGKEATLVGFVGKVPAGWKVYPLHTIVELELNP